jgi:uncharacterized membrane protein
MICDHQGLIFTFDWNIFILSSVSMSPVVAIIFAFLYSLFWLLISLVVGHQEYNLLPNNIPYLFNLDGSTYKSEKKELVYQYSYAIIFSVTLFTIFLGLVLHKLLPPLSKALFTRTDEDDHQFKRLIGRLKIWTYWFAAMVSELLVCHFLTIITVSRSGEPAQPFIITYSFICFIQASFLIYHLFVTVLQKNPSSLGGFIKERRMIREEYTQNTI